MKKLVLLSGVLLFTVCAQQEFVIIPEKKKTESRERLKESIACSAGDLLKKTTQELKNQAHALEQAETDKEVASVLTSIACTQEILFTIIQELIECDGDDRWAHASKKELAHARDVFKKLVEESKNSTKNWWQSLAQTLEDALPTRD